MAITGWREFPALPALSIDAFCLPRAAAAERLSKRWVTIFPPLPRPSPFDAKITAPNNRE